MLYYTLGRSNLGLTAGLMPLVCLAHVVFFPVAFPVSKILDWTVGSHPGITLRSRKAKIEEVILLSSPSYSFVPSISSLLACFSLTSFSFLSFSSSDYYYSFIPYTYFLILLIIIIVIIIIIIVILNIICLPSFSPPGT